MEAVSSLTELHRQGEVQQEIVWSDDHIEELQMGLITSAINDVRDGRKSKKMQQEAREWILCDDISLPLSYFNCCRSIGLDGELLRELLNYLVKGDLYESH